MQSSTGWHFGPPPGPGGPLQELGSSVTATSCMWSRHCLSSMHVCILPLQAAGNPVMAFTYSCVRQVLRAVQTVEGLGVSQSGNLGGLSGPESWSLKLHSVSLRQSSYLALHLAG